MKRKTIYPSCGGSAHRNRKCRLCFNTERIAERIKHRKESAPDGYRLCQRCKEIKLLEGNFWKSSAVCDGYSRWCNICSNETRRVLYNSSEEVRKRHSDNRKIYAKTNPNYSIVTRRSKLKNKFGMTLEDFDRMVAEQNGLCKLCNTSDLGGKKIWCIDHCHEGGQVRGLLCVNCNTWLGTMEALIKKTGLKNLLSYSGPLARMFEDYIKEQKQNI